MRIALASHLASRSAPTGAERSLLLLAGGLSARGHEVVVTTPGRWVLDAEFSALRIPVRAVPVRTCWLTQYGPQPWWHQIGRGVRFALPDPGSWALRRWLKGIRADALHVNCLPHIRAARAGKTLGVPVVWHIREILHPGPRRTFFAAQIRRNATRIVAVSEAVAAWVRAEGLGERTTVVHNGVDPPQELFDQERARRRLGLDGDGVVVGLFGQLIPHKGALDFVRAAHLAAARAPALLRFVLAGDGPPAFAAEIRRSVEAGPAAGRISVLPPQGNIWELLGACDVVAQTSLWPDPLPRVVMESMAAGRPVLAFANGGVGEMVQNGDTGLLFETGDCEGLAAAMVDLGCDPDRRRRMGEAGARRARGLFSVERHVLAMEKIFLQSRGSGS